MLSEISERHVASISTPCCYIFLFCWVSRGTFLENHLDLLQQLLHILAQFNSSPFDLLDEIACTVLAQVIPSAVLMISPFGFLCHNEII
jgi:hypothetical protein